jgi:ABC-type protease/lipase transport system fused ATPase/permease subunit
LCGGSEPEKLSGKEMADALYAAGSEPAFFMLDDEGNSDFDDEGSEAACPACGKMRADALGANVFKVGSVCPYCGHVEGGSDD